MKTLGGKTPALVVRSATNLVLSPTIAIRYTWHGLRGKDSLKSTQFGKCILNAFVDANMSEYSIGVIAGDWLRHAAEKKQKEILMV